MADDIKVDVSQLAFFLGDMDGNVERFLDGVTEDVNAGSEFLLGKVLDGVAKRKIVGATGLFKDSIHVVPAERDADGIKGGVTSDSAYAPFIEYGTGPHKNRKSPMFWKAVLQPWVHLKLAPRGGVNPASGKKQTTEQAEVAIAIGIGRKIEKEGTEARPVFGDALDDYGEKAFDLVSKLILDRLAAEMDDATRGAA
jgi:hypothetical protein